jgi:hypothetical protein
MHWFDKKENKLCHVQLDIGFGHGTMSIHGEDAEIDPERGAPTTKASSCWATKNTAIR